MTPLKSAQAKAWKWFSIMIRLRDADEYGLVTCITCSHRGHWRTFDAGHFLPKGSYKGVKWNEKNVHAQCGQCNCFNEGNRLKYREVMLKRYGFAVVDMLEIAGKGSSKLSLFDFQAMAQDFEKRARQLAIDKNQEDRL